MRNEKESSPGSSFVSSCGLRDSRRIPDKNTTSSSNSILSLYRTVNAFSSSVREEWYVLNREKGLIGPTTMRGALSAATIHNSEGDNKVITNMLQTLSRSTELPTRPSDLAEPNLVSSQSQYLRWLFLQASIELTGDTWNQHSRMQQENLLSIGQCNQTEVGRLHLHRFLLGLA